MGPNLPNMTITQEEETRITGINLVSYFEKDNPSRGNTKVQLIIGLGSDLYSKSQSKGSCWTKGGRILGCNSIGHYFLQLTMKGLGITGGIGLEETPCTILGKVG